MDKRELAPSTSKLNANAASDKQVEAVVTTAHINETETNTEDATSNVLQNSRLNHLSDQFDACLALYTPNYEITNRKQKVYYQNVAAYESAYKKFGALEMAKATKKLIRAGPAKNTAATNDKATCDNETLQRRFLPHQMCIKTEGIKNKRHTRNIFTHMESHEGPLARLYKCITQNEQVKVQVRNEHGVRGYITGKLHIFDKDWNMLLTHALVVWQRRKYKYGVNNMIGVPQDCSQQLKKLGIKLPELKVKSLNRKNVEVSKHCKQLLLRGNEVVLLQIIKTENVNVQATLNEIA